MLNTRLERGILICLLLLFHESNDGFFKRMLELVRRIDLLVLLKAAAVGVVNLYIIQCDGCSGDFISHREMNLIKKNH